MAAVAPFRYRRIYGAWCDRIIAEDAEGAVARSAARYIAAIEGTLPGIAAQSAT